jgi:glycogen(starch) synthase
MMTKQLTMFLHGKADLVLLVSDEFPPETGFGGIGSYTWNMSQGLLQQGCRVVVISKSLTASGVTVEGNLAVIRFSSMAFWQKVLFKLSSMLSIERTLRSLLFSWLVMWQIKQIKKMTDILAIEGPEWNAQLFMIAKYTPWPFVMRLHTPLATIMRLDHLDQSLDTDLSLRLEAYSVSKAQTILYASDLSINDARLALPINNQRLIKLPLPINSQVFEANSHRASRPTIVFVGRLEAKKGIVDLVEALPFIRRKIPTITCMIIGPDGLDEQGGSMRQRLEAIITKSDLADVVEFIGPVAYTHLPHYLQQAWVVVNPSRFESFGMTSLEAIACGSRVVVYDTVGFAEWLKPEFGCVVETKDAAGLAKAAIPYLSLPPVIKQEEIANTFDIRKVASQALEVYRSMK